VKQFSNFIWPGRSFRLLIVLLVTALIVTLLGVVLLSGSQTTPPGETVLDDFDHPQVFVKPCDNTASIRERVTLPVLGQVDREIGGGALSGNPAGAVTMNVGGGGFAISSQSDGACEFSFPALLRYHVVGEPADLSSYSALTLKLESGVFQHCSVEIETQPFAVYVLALDVTLSNTTVTLPLSGIPNLNQVSALTVGKHCTLGAHQSAVMAPIGIE